MGRSNANAKRTNETHLQWRSRIALAASNDRNRAEPIVTPEAERQSRYVSATTEEGGERAVTKRNVASSPLTRWRSMGMLSASQEAGIAHALRLWEFMERPSSTTGGYGEKLDGGPGWGANEARCVNEIEARQDLRRIEGYIPKPYWRVFENCVRFDEPAGVIGSSLGHGNRGAAVRAHLTVCVVADTIAMNERLVSWDIS